MKKLSASNRNQSQQAVVIGCLSRLLTGIFFHQRTPSRSSLSATGMARQSIEFERIFQIRFVGRAAEVADNYYMAIQKFNRFLCN